MREPAIWWHFEHAAGRSQYVQRVLDGYRRTPTCAGTVRREDRRLAHRLYDQKIPTALLEAAFALAAMRRLYRPCQDESIVPVRSLHYFLPILDEIRQQAIDPDYIDYVQWKLRNAHRIQSTRQLPSSPPR